MSGPKVVKVVTREEVIATCQGHIAEVVAAFEHWCRVGHRNDLLTPHEVQLGEARITDLRHMLAQDKFTELQKQAPMEVAFLKADIAARIEKAAEMAAQGRNEDRRRLRAADALANALASKGFAVPPALTKPIACSGEELKAAISQGLALLSPTIHDNEVTNRQRELAEKLGGGEGSANLTDWLAVHAPPEADAALADVERRLEALRALDPERGRRLSLRLEKVSADQSARRSLLLDSLAMDIAAERQATLEEADARERLRSIEVRLATVDTPGATSQLAAIRDHGLADRSLGEVIALTEQAAAALETAIEERAEIDRRRAVLDGLAQLGYEVKEGMQTAWVDKGRVVLKSSKRSGYGVEVGGIPSKGMQLRTVSFSNAGDKPDTGADIEAEIEFCGDFSALQATLAAEGGAISVIKALGVGTTPIKKVGRAEGAQEETSTATPNTTNRGFSDPGKRV